MEEYRNIILHNDFLMLALVTEWQWLIEVKERIIVMNLLPYGNLW